MRPVFYLLLSVFLIACGGSETSANLPEEELQQEPLRVDQPQFQTFLDSAGLIGSILIYDFDARTYYSNNFKRADSGFLPASTFKIPNSIIALENGIVANDSTIIPWDGKPRRMKIWEQDLYFRDAFQYSCLPCYQEIAAQIGDSTMKAELKRLNYPHMNVNADNLTTFWIVGDSHISQFEQIDFLTRLHTKKLPISEHTSTIMQRIMLIENTATYTLSGKTGWAVTPEENIGWFVGYVERKNHTYYFATNVQPSDPSQLNNFLSARKTITRDALRSLDMID